MHTYFYRAASISALCLFLVSCGPAPQGERMPIPSATRSQSASTSAPMPAQTGSMHSSATDGLPASAAIDFNKKPLLTTFFRNEPNVNRLEDLYASTRGTVQNMSIVSNCDLDVLKAFVATGWAPIIRSRRSARGQLSAIMRYDDVDQQIQIGNPLDARAKGARSRAGRKLGYAEFEKEWATGSGNKCVLITPKRLHDVEIHAALKRYLPEDRVGRVQVRSR